jgi:two-component system chemotaxis response regulator CheB
MAYDVVAIGASWGGLAALRELLGALPGDFAAPIVVVQHRMSSGDDELLPALLNSATALSVREATDKSPLAAGEVVVAPPDYHMLVEPGAVALSADAPVQFSRPSIDVLLESAAEAYRERAVGVILTGANDDGADGLAAIRRRGGLAIVQDPADAVRTEMPQAALNAVPDARRLLLREIAPALEAMVGRVERTGTISGNDRAGNDDPGMVG